MHTPIPDEQVLPALSKLFEEVLITGSFLCQREIERNSRAKNDFDFILNYTDANDDNEKTLIIPTGHAAMFQRDCESFIFQVDRLFKWLDAVKRRGLITKKSKVYSGLSGEFKNVREYRNVLLHLEEYKVTGRKNAKSKHHGGSTSFSVDPDSVMIMTNCMVNGQKVQNAYQLGGRVELFNLVDKLLAGYIGFLDEYHN